MSIPRGRFVPSASLNRLSRVSLAIVITSAMACDRPASDSPSSASSGEMPQPVARDLHSYGNPGEVVVRHLDLEWDVRFDRRALDGTATLEIERLSESADTLRLDTRDLSVSAVDLTDDGQNWSPTRFGSTRPP